MEASGQEPLLPTASSEGSSNTRLHVLMLRSSVYRFACLALVVALVGFGSIMFAHKHSVPTKMVADDQKKFDLIGKSIYFIMTDRFARSGTDDQNNSFCDLATPQSWFDSGTDYSPHLGITAGPRAAFGGRCGGTFRGILDRLSYIKGMGFDCIWITPVIRASDYTGYAAEDFFQIDPHLGTSETLKELADALHAHGMCLIIDVVLNHVRQMSYVWVDFKDLLKFGANAPVNSTVAYIGPGTIFPFNEPKYFHTYGGDDAPDFEWFVMNGLPPMQVANSLGNSTVLQHHWEKGLVQCGPEHLELTTCLCMPGNSGPHCPGSNPTLQKDGWFASFADLNQSVPFVRAQLIAYMMWLRDGIGNDAFRLDTAIYMPKEFLAEVQRVVDIDIMGEATVNNLTYHASFQDNVLNALLNFPVFYYVPRAFCQMHILGNFSNFSMQGRFTSEAPNLTKLAAVIKTQQKSGLYSNLDLLGNFVDNHDEMARIGHYCKGDVSRIRNALAWLMLSRGTPIIYYGTEQGLTGHQYSAPYKNKHPNRTWVQFSSQAQVRESLWQTHYDTTTWQYKFIAVLNHVRKKFRITVGEQEVVFASEGSMIFTRTAPDGSTVWVFINNVKNSNALKPVTYCPGPPPSALSHTWVDAISGDPAFLTGGCFEARDAGPKVLVQINQEK